MGSQLMLIGSGWKAVGLLMAAVWMFPALGFTPQEASTGDPLGTKSGNVQVLGQSFGPDATSRSFLGVHVREVDGERAKTKGLAEERGVEITKIVAESAADNAGMQVGDVVLQYNDERVDGATEFIRLVRETPVGRRVSMTVFRDGKELNLEATLGEKKEQWAVFKRGGPVVEIPRIEMSDIVVPDVPHVFTTWRSSRLGIVGESLESQLAEFFGVTEGVLVRSVSEDTPAARAGLKAGDVITKVGEDSVTTPRAVTMAIREREESTVVLTLMRDRKQIEISVTLEEPAGSGTKVNQRFIFANPISM
jgi:serine protease Do